MSLPVNSRRNAAVAATTVSLLAVALFAYNFRLGIKDFLWRASQEPVPEAMTAEEARQLNLPGAVMDEVKSGEAAIPAVETEKTTAMTEPEAGSGAASDGVTTKQPDPAAGSREPATADAETVPPKSEERVAEGGLPREINLAVPMVYQAPLQVWDALHEDACEEASMLMLKLFIQGKPAPSREEMDRLINQVVDYEMETLGYFEDTDAGETARVMRDFLGLAGATAVEIESVDDIRRELASGQPVIIPAYGKALKNPNFRNGGPDYHMLVIKGYTATKIITNDPGTRRGADYQYDPAVVWDAIHDWNGGRVTEGRKMMIVVR